MKLDYASHTTAHKSNLNIKENKSSCVFINANKVELFKIKVDGGLIADSAVAKCDYIVYWYENKPNSQVVFIELKGTDIPKAFLQVENTIHLTRDKFSEFAQKQCVIVCSRMRMPKNDSTMMRLKKRMKELTGSVPIIKSQRHDYLVNT